MHDLGTSGHVRPADDRRLPVERADGTDRRRCALYGAPGPAAGPFDHLRSGAGGRIGAECRAFIALGAFAIGIDLNPGPANRHVLVGDFHDPQFADASVDIVYTNCLDHSFELEKVMQGVARVLKPGGAFIADLMNGSGDGAPWKPDGYDCLFWDSTADIVDRIQQLTRFAVESDTPMTSAWGWSGRMVVFRKA